jgi:hypothetical protein
LDHAIGASDAGFGIEMANLPTRKHDRDRLACWRATGVNKPLSNAANGAEAILDPTTLNRAIDALSGSLPSVQDPLATAYRDAQEALISKVDGGLKTSVFLIAKRALIGRSGIPAAFALTTPFEEFPQLGLALSLGIARSRGGPPAPLWRNRP